MSVHDGRRGVEFPVERDARGQIASRAALADRFRIFMEEENHKNPMQCICALPARGVSLRTFELPLAPREKLAGLLTLQLEAQLPVSPRELAWGYLPAPQIPGGGLHQFIVAAIRKEFFDDYTTFFADLGLKATFVVAALHRKPLAANSPDRFSVVDFGQEKSEIVSFRGSVPHALRIAPWGAKSLPNEEAINALQTEKLYCTGDDASQLAKFANAAEVLASPAGAGLTAAITHLQQAGSDAGTLFLSVADGSATLPQRGRSWAAAACLLGALAFLSLRYAESTFYKGSVNNKIAALNQSRSALPTIENELRLLNYIKTNQPPYLDTVAVIANCAPPGTKIDSLAVLRRGEVTLRGSVNDPQAPARFRSKLVDSGFFSKVTVEEQTPVQNGQQVNFRLSAHLKPDGSRRSLPPEAPLPAGRGEINNPKQGKVTSGAQ